MKIIFFIGSLNRNGAERVISTMANHYASIGCDVEICLLLNYNIEYDLNSKIKVNDFTIDKGSYITKAPKWINKIRKYLKKIKPDKIVSFIGRINILVEVASRGLKIPTIVSERNDPLSDGRSKFILRLCNKYYKKAEAVVFQTNYQKNCFADSKNFNSYIIENPISVKYKMSDTIPHYIVTAGRLLPQKNHAMLIKAIDILRKDYPDVKLSIFGSGIKKEDLNNLIDKLNLGSNVEIIDNVNNLHERIKKAQIFTMTSEYEGMSNALLEAMMMGLACISTNYNGIEDVIIDMENGIIVPKNDSVKLAQAISKIFSDAELKEKLSKNALLSSSKFEENNVLKKWDDVILKNVTNPLNTK